MEIKKDISRPEILALPTNIPDQLEKLLKKQFTDDEKEIIQIYVYHQKQIFSDPDFKMSSGMVDFNDLIFLRSFTRDLDELIVLENEVLESKNKDKKKKLPGLIGFFKEKVFRKNF